MIRLGVGLFCLGGLIGLRLVVAPTDGIEAEIAELERFEAVASTPALGLEDPAPEEPSWTARLEEIGGGLLGDKPRTASEDRLVQCQLEGRLLFMRAGDCLGRGGEAMEAAAAR